MRIRLVDRICNSEAKSFELDTGIFVGASAYEIGDLCERSAGRVDGQVDRPTRFDDGLRLRILLDDAQRWLVRHIG